MPPLMIEVRLLRTEILYIGEQFYNRYHFISVAQSSHLLRVRNAELLFNKGSKRSPLQPKLCPITEQGTLPVTLDV